MTTNQSEDEVRAICTEWGIIFTDGEPDPKFVTEIQALISQKIIDAELSHFHYSDWHIGDDDVLRMGDYIYCNHQRPHDGYETDFEGQIVQHHANGMAVVIHNVDPNEPENSGDYASLQDMFMNGWEFSRIATLTQGIKKEEL